MKEYTRATLFILLVGIIIFTGISVYANTTDNTIKACISKDGLLHINISGTDCKKGQTSLIWNIQGPQGDSGFTLPKSLAPTVSNVTICKERSGTGIAFRWLLSNEYGPIPKKVSADQNISTGISWGEVTIKSNISPNYQTYSWKANGTHHTISFPSTDSIGNGSALEFSGNVFWNGFTIPLTYSGTWSENLPQCSNDGFNEGF